MELPDQANYYSVCGARLRDIKALENDLAKCMHGNRAFQKLPRHMQRRSVSHNPQRLPRSLREKHKREVNNIIKKSKRPSRKFRRRPSNLMSEYSRRQKDHMWLETHIWHSKRFHMVNKWSYRLPKTPTNKSYRASLRAATNSCLLQDVSYECANEVEGEYKRIISVFRSMTSSQDAEAFTQKDFIDGKYWIQVQLFMPQKCPYQALGHVQIQCCLFSNETCKLWIWSHPSSHQYILSNLIDAFQLNEMECKDNDDNSPLPFAIDPLVNAKLAPREFFHPRYPKYTSSSVTLTVLKDSLVKFRLIGPRSCYVIHSVLQPSDVEQKSDLNSQDDEKQDSFWWKTFYSDSEHREDLKQQLSLWSFLRSNITTPSRRIIGFVARDPRIVLPVKQISIVNDQEESKSDVAEKTIVNNIGKVNHPIYSKKIRDSVTVHLPTTQTINEKRSSLLVPGSGLPLDDSESRLPVLLMERCGTYADPQLGRGWDVILPAGIGAQTLVSFALNGVAIGGQNEEEVLQREFLLPPNPHSIPDTAAFELNAREDEKDKRDFYFRRPPLCRVNFIKLGVRFPFGIHWFELAKNWDPSTENLFVLRNKSLLNFLAIKSSNKLDKILSKRLKKDDPEGIPEVDTLNSNFTNTEVQSITKEEVKHSLVYVRLILTGKGSLEPFAMIALPTEEDLKNRDANIEIVEPIHEDTKATERKNLKKDHITLMNSLRRKRKKARQDVLEQETDPLEKHSTIQDALRSAVDDVLVKNEETVKMVSTYSPTMERLWLQDRDQIPFQCCSKKIFGFLTHGGFSSKLGRPGGLGYVMSVPLLEHMQSLGLVNFDSQSETNPENLSVVDKDQATKQVLVLIRNPTSFVYRWARLVVINVW